MCRPAERFYSQAPLKQLTGQRPVPNVVHGTGMLPAKHAASRSVQRGGLTAAARKLLNPP